MVSYEFSIIEYGSPLWKNAVSLRERILRKPFGLQFTQEELSEEKDYIQVVAVRKGQVIGTAVLVPEGPSLKMQRVVVNESMRNLQIGTAMMAYCEEYARKNRYYLLYCSARNTAVNFYTKNGYRTTGEYYLEDGIPHVRMDKILKQS